MERGDLNGITCIKPVTVTNSDLKRVITSARMKSETRNVIPVKIEYSPIDSDGENDEEKEVIICDSPGFGDNRSAEIDISNSIILKRSVDCCLGIKPIVIVNKDMGPRKELFSRLTQTLVKLLPDQSKIQENVTYLFTGYESNNNKKEFTKS